MMPWMPHLTLWGSPLYGELCIGLWRALAAPWCGGLPPVNRRDTAGRSLTTAGAGEILVSATSWRLLDSHQSEPHPIGAASLAELCRTVRGARDQNGISSSRSS